jgi:hypothetical protein
MNRRARSALALVGAVAVAASSVVLATREESFASFPEVQRHARVEAETQIEEFLVRALNQSEFTLWSGYSAEPARRYIEFVQVATDKRFSRDVPEGFQVGHVARDGTIVGDIPDIGGSPTHAVLLTPQGETISLGWGYPAAVGPDDTIWVVPGNVYDKGDHTIRAYSTAGRLLQRFSLPSDAYPIYPIAGGAIVQLHQAVYRLDLASGDASTLGAGEVRAVVNGRMNWKTCDRKYACSSRWSPIGDPGRATRGPALEAMVLALNVSPDGKSFVTRDEVVHVASDRLVRLDDYARQCGELVWSSDSSNLYWACNGSYGGIEMVAGKGTSYVLGSAPFNATLFGAVGFDAAERLQFAPPWRAVELPAAVTRTPTAPRFNEPANLAHDRAALADAASSLHQVDLVARDQRMYTIELSTGALSSKDLSLDQYIAAVGGAVQRGDRTVVRSATTRTLIDIAGALIGVGGDGLIWLSTENATLAVDGDGSTVAQFPPTSSNRWSVTGGLVVNDAGSIYFFDARTQSIRFIGAGDVDSVQHDQILWTRCAPEATCQTFFGPIGDPTRRIIASSPSGFGNQTIFVSPSGDQVVSSLFWNHRIYSYEFVDAATGDVTGESAYSSGIWNADWSRDGRWFVAFVDQEQAGGPNIPMVVFFDTRLTRSYSVVMPDISGDAYPERIIVSSHD